MGRFRDLQILAIKVASETPELISCKQPSLLGLDENRSTISTQTPVFLEYKNSPKITDKKLCQNKRFTPFLDAKAD